MYFISVFIEAEICVISEAVNYGLVHPSSFLLFQGLWKIPMIQGDHWFDAGLLQFVDQIVVILHS